MWYGIVLAGSLVVFVIFKRLRKVTAPAPTSSASFSSSSSSSNSTNSNDKSSDKAAEELTAAELKAKKLAVFGSLSTFPYTLFLAAFSLVNFSFAFLSALITIPFITLQGRSKLSFVLSLILNPILILYILGNEEALKFISVNYLNDIVIPQVSVAYIFDIFADYFSLFFPFISLVLLPLNLLQIELSLQRF